MPRLTPIYIYDEGINTMNPWDDMKLAFSIEDEDAVWEALGLGGSLLDLMPSGWSMVETDASGARYVAVFRYEGSSRGVGSGASLIKALLDYCQGAGPHPVELGYMF